MGQQDRILARLAHNIFLEVSTKKRDFHAKFIQENGKWASYIKNFAFGREHEEKAKEAHKNERKEAHQRYLKDKGLPANDDKCEEDARRDTDWSWFDLGGPEREQVYIQRELEGLKGWKDGDAKPPTPVLDRLHFCLKESGTGVTLNRFVQVCTWEALCNKQLLAQDVHHPRGGGHPKEEHDDFVVVGGSAQQILAAIETREKTLDGYLALKRILPDTYEQSRALLHLVRAHIEKNGVPDSAV
ncbi:hypothetical protein B0H65DRAFT_463857 [Neurospora tetraspora]|uniref:Uncharacterized protein n=1 Tax=Neurospora tetraspora TaxID=94610 RepID=A0AAE0MR35_9PEZI|nr:hypothetical protein B0H65DRAFT_463857 [Neurospora tetraspora]